MSAVEKAQKIIVAIYEVPVAGQDRARNSLATATAWPCRVRRRGCCKRFCRPRRLKTVVAAMGSPYIVSQFPEIQTYLCTFSNMNVSEISAVKAMFGEIPMPGHMPVTIPNIATRGAGLNSPAQRTSGGSE